MVLGRFTRRSITFRERILSSASYLNIASWRSAPRLENGLLRPGAAENHDFQDLHNFHDFQFFIKETGLEDFNRLEALHATSF